VHAQQPHSHCGKGREGMLGSPHGPGVDALNGWAAVLLDESCRINQDFVEGAAALPSLATASLYFLHTPGLKV